MQALSVREKREFYAGLARLIRSGSSLPKALELLSRDTPRELGKFLQALLERILAGESLGEALLHQQPRVTELEASILTSSARGGRLDHGCDQLTRYFDALERARLALRKRSLYPLVLLHLSILTLNLPTLLKGGGDVTGYLEGTLGILAILYGGAGLVYVIWQALAKAASDDAGLDSALARLPGVGAVRTNFALARFFATLDAQLEAGVNIWEAFANAARSSGSGRLRAAARKSMPMLQAGERLSEALSRNKVVPATMIRAFRVAEEAGELDQELPLLAEGVERKAVETLERWSEWLPKILYGLVMLYIAYQVVSAVSAYYGQVQKMIDSGIQ